MIYEQNLIEIKNIPNKFIRFKIYENILHFFKSYKLNIMPNNFHITLYVFSYNFI